MLERRSNPQGLKRAGSFSQGRSLFGAHRHRADGGLPSEARPRGGNGVGVRKLVEKSPSPEVDGYHCGGWRLPRGRELSYAPAIRHAGT